MSEHPELDRIFQAHTDKLRLELRESTERIQDFAASMEIDPDYQPKRRWWARFKGKGKT